MGDVVVRLENLGGTVGPMEIVARGNAPFFIGGGDLDGDGDDDLVVPWSFEDRVRTYTSVGGTRWTGDLGGADLVLQDGDQLSGTLTNVGLLHVPTGARVTLEPGSPTVVEALEVLVEGLIDGTGAGHRGPGGYGGFIEDGFGSGAGSGGDTSGASGGGHGGRSGAGAARRCSAGCSSPVGSAAPGSASSTDGSRRRWGRAAAAARGRAR